MDPLTIAAIAKTAGTVFGAIQSAQGAAKSRQADRMAPDIIDPNRVSDMEEIRRRQAYLSAGTDTTTQQAIQNASQTTKATQRDIARSTGGNVAGTVSGLLQSQKMGGAVQNQAFAAAGERGLQMGNLYNKIAEDISQRKLDIQQYRYAQKKAESARLKKEGSANLMAGLSTLLGSKFGEKTPPSGDTSTTSDSADLSGLNADNASQIMNNASLGFGSTMGA